MCWACCCRASRAAKAVDLGGLTVESLLLKRMTLAIAPPMAAEARAAVVEWAAVDTEQIPDHVWTAPDGAVSWDLEEVVGWCLDPKRWGNVGALASQPAERIVTMFDGQIFCALAPPAAEKTMKQLESLVRGWGVRVIPGPPEYAWAAPRL
jgi:hypothetical protein